MIVEEYVFKSSRNTKEGMERRERERKEEMEARKDPYAWKAFKARRKEEWRKFEESLYNISPICEVNAVSEVKNRS
jgi:hypothetical protein